MFNYNIIKPEIFDNKVTAFFTTKSLGVNKNLIAKLLSIKEDNIVFPIQTHSDIVLILDKYYKNIEADAIITQKTGILIGVKVADCIPILIYDKKNNIIGAVHAGWRGTAKEIISKTIKTMVKNFSSKPANILVALGPSIKGCCYNVGKDVLKELRKVVDSKFSFYKKINDKYYIDLSFINIMQMLNEGIEPNNIWNSNYCTYCNPDKFFSYRYMKKYNGSQGGFIGII